MDLTDLIRRVNYEDDGEHVNKPVQIMTPAGRRYDLLSLNWDPNRGVWLLIGDQQ